MKYALYSGAALVVAVVAAACGGEELTGGGTVNGGAGNVSTGGSGGKLTGTGGASAGTNNGGTDSAGAAGAGASDSGGAGTAGAGGAPLVNRDTYYYGEQRTGTAVAGATELVKVPVPEGVGQIFAALWNIPEVGWTGTDAGELTVQLDPDSGMARPHVLSNNSYGLGMTGAGFIALESYEKGVKLVANATGGGSPKTLPGKGQALALIAVKALYYGKNDVALAANLSKPEASYEFEITTEADNQQTVFWLDAANIVSVGAGICSLSLKVGAAETLYTFQSVPAGQSSAPLLLPATLKLSKAGKYTVNVSLGSSEQDHSCSIAKDDLGLFAFPAPAGATESITTGWYNDPSKSVVEPVRKLEVSYEHVEGNRRPAFLSLSDPWRPVGPATLGVAFNGATPSTFSLVVQYQRRPVQFLDDVDAAAPTNKVTVAMETVPANPALVPRAALVVY